MTECTFYLMVHVSGEWARVEQGQWLRATKEKWLKQQRLCASSTDINADSDRIKAHHKSDAA